MKRLAARLCTMVLAAFFSLLTLTAATAPPDTAQQGGESLSARILGFAVKFLVARLFWGS